MKECVIVPASISFVSSPKLFNGFYFGVGGVVEVYERLAFELILRVYWRGLNLLHSSRDLLLDVIKNRGISTENKLTFCVPYYGRCEILVTFSWCCICD